MLGAIGTSEVLVIVIVVLLFFGSKQLPDIVRTLSKGWRDLQRISRQVKEEMNDIIDNHDHLMG